MRLKEKIMIKINNLCKSYDFEVLKDINLELPDRGFVALVGESGSGKSTLLKCVGLLENITSGEIIFDNKNLADMSPFKKDKQRGKIFAYIPQSTSLMEDETVDKGLSYFSSDIEKRNSVLEKLGISDKANEIARNLSGGERQRVAIAQALLREAPVLLCDEITANLDPQNAEQVHAILKEISKDRLVLCVGHNPQMLTKYADRMITLKDGTVEKDEILSHSSNVKDYPQPLVYAKQTSVGAKKFFRIFSRGMKSKIARIVFGVLFLFLSMSALCFGITQKIAGSYSLIRKQADLLGVDFAQIEEYQDGAFIASNTVMLNSWAVFVDFEKEKEHFNLVEGRFPENDDEALITQYQAKFEGIKIGDSTFVMAPDKNATVCGIIEGDLSAYLFSYRTPEDYLPYGTLTAAYCTIGKLNELEDTMYAKSFNPNTLKYENVRRYHDEEILAGRQINDNAADTELLVTTGFLEYTLGYGQDEIKANTQAIFDKLNKYVTINGYNFVIVGICDNDKYSSFMKKGSILYLDSSSGYVMPIEEINKDNFKQSTFGFIYNANQNNTLLTKIGLPIFAVFAVLAAIVVINLNIFETDEKKILFRNMRQSGFSKQSLLAYNLFVDMLIFAIAVVLFLIIGLPVISNFQLTKTQFELRYIYVLNGWAVLTAIAVTAIITLVSYLVTLKKFDKEISECSKL